MQIINLRRETCWSQSVVGSARVASSIRRRLLKDALRRCRDPFVLIQKQVGFIVLAEKEVDWYGTISEATSTKPCHWRLDSPGPYPGPYKV